MGSPPAVEIPWPLTAALAAIATLVLVAMGSVRSARSAARRFDGYPVE